MALFSNDDEKLEEISLELAQLRESIRYNAMYDDKISALENERAELLKKLNKQEDLIRSLKQERDALIKRVHGKHAETQRLHAKIKKLERREKAKPIKIEDIFDFD